MRHALIAVSMLLCSMTAAARVDISIGINLPVFPQLVRIPDYPVYYAPSVSENYFFYDGLYWVFTGDNWYVSSWYNGPWSLVDRFDVPVFLLRVPVRYYRHAPAYFHGWRASDAPRWGEHWGSSWQERRSGWDQWNRGSAPPPAPLPTYQRQYTGNQYPQPAQQAVIQTQNYRYQPQDGVARQHFQQQRAQAQSAPQQPAVQQSQPAPQQRQREARQPQAVQPQVAQPQPTLSNRAETARQQQQQQQQQQHVERQPQPQHVERQAQPQPQPQQARPAREQPQAQVQPAPQPQRAERAPQQAPAAREQPQAPEKGRGHEENKGQGHEKDKDNKEKG